MSYLALEHDKQLFFGTSLDGVIGYGIVDDVAVVNGDPVCASSDFPVLLAEFKSFCKNNGYSVVFLYITDAFLQKYWDAGFAYVKAGEKARFDLLTYTLKGNRAGKVRASVNHAAKTCSVFEYRPLVMRDDSTEQQIAAVSADWFKGKRTEKLVFSVGTTSLDEPMDRRYFCARDSSGSICAFTVFIPFTTQEGRGYMADVTRRIHDAPGGIADYLNALYR